MSAMCTAAALSAGRGASGCGGARAASWRAAASNREVRRGDPSELIRRSSTQVESPGLAYDRTEPGHGKAEPMRSIVTPTALVAGGVAAQCRHRSPPEPALAVNA